MKAFGPILAQSLQFAAIAILATSAFSQAAPKYDAATETTLKGTVQELKLVPPSGGKPIVYLAMKGSPDSVEVFVCPKKFLDDIGVSFKALDEIEVTGSKVKQNGTDLILAREVMKGGETLTFRSKDGKPAW